MLKSIFLFLFVIFSSLHATCDLYSCVSSDTINAVETVTTVTDDFYHLTQSSGNTQLPQDESFTQTCTSSLVSDLTKSYYIKSQSDTNIEIWLTQTTTTRECQYSNIDNNTSIDTNNTDTYVCTSSIELGNGMWNNGYEVIDENGVNYATASIDENFDCVLASNNDSSNDSNTSSTNNNTSSSDNNNTSTDNNTTTGSDNTSNTGSTNGNGSDNTSTDSSTSSTGDNSSNDYTDILNQINDNLSQSNTNMESALSDISSDISTSSQRNHDDLDNISGQLNQSNESLSNINQQMTNMNDFMQSGMDNTQAGDSLDNAKNQATSTINSITGSLNGIISSYTGTAPVVTGTGIHIFTTPPIYGKTITFDLSMFENLRQYFDILWLLMLAYFNFKMYVLIIRDLLKKF